MMVDLLGAAFKRSVVGTPSASASLSQVRDVGLWVFLKIMSLTRVGFDPTFRERERGLCPFASITSLRYAALLSFMSMLEISYTLP